MTGITTYLSIITLNVNGLNSPIKRHRLVGGIKKQYLTIYCLQYMHFTEKDKHRHKIKGWKIIFKQFGI
jgi:exonuclease III